MGAARAHQYSGLTQAFFGKKSHPRSEFLRGGLGGWGWGGEDIDAENLYEVNSENTEQGTR